VPLACTSPHRAFFEENYGRLPVLTGIPAALFSPKSLKHSTLSLEHSRLATPLLRFLGRMLNSSAKRVFEPRQSLHRDDSHVKEFLRNEH
jgi:hypothetical protein